MPENYDGAGSNPQVVSRFIRFIEIYLVNRDRTGHRCPKHRPSHPARTIDWTSTVQETRESEGKGSQQGRKEAETHPEDLAPGIDWPSTKDRFCNEMARVYFSQQPTGEVINPETAYTKIHNSSKKTSTSQ